MYFIATLLSLNHINLCNGGKSIFRELVLKTGAKLTSVEEAIRASQSNIVILAVPKDFYEKQPIHLLEGKVGMYLLMSATKILFTLKQSHR